MYILDHRDSQSSRCVRKHKKKRIKSWLRSGNLNPWPNFFTLRDIFIVPSQRQYLSERNEFLCTIGNL